MKIILKNFSVDAIKAELVKLYIGMYSIVVYVPIACAVVDPEIFPLINF